MGVVLDWRVTNPLKMFTSHTDTSIGPTATPETNYLSEIKKQAINGQILYISSLQNNLLHLHPPSIASTGLSSNLTYNSSNDPQNKVHRARKLSCDVRPLGYDVTKALPMTGIARQGGDTACKSIKSQALAQYQTKPISFHKLQKSVVCWMQENACNWHKSVWDVPLGMVYYPGDEASGCQHRGSMRCYVDPARCFYMFLRKSPRNNHK